MEKKRKKRYLLIQIPRNIDEMIHMRKDDRSLCVRACVCVFVCWRTSAVREKTEGGDASRGRCCGLYMIRRVVH